MTDIYVYEERPEGFQSQVEVAGCYCIHAGNLLVLKRHPDRPQGLTWGIPCGKLEKEETPLTAVKREVMEEVGILLEDPHSLGALYMQRGPLCYIYHMFEAVTDKAIALNLHEHTECLVP